MTLPCRPLSLPAMTWTVSPFLIRMSEHLRCQRDDLHEALVAQLTADRAEDARAARLAVGLEDPRGVLEDLDDAPALRRGQRPGLHEEDAVADAGAVLLVVSLQLVRAANDLAVHRVLEAVLDGDDDGLVHLVADDEALAGLAEPALLVLTHVLVILTCGAHATSPLVVMPSSRSRMVV